MNPEYLARVGRHEKKNVLSYQRRTIDDVTRLNSLRAGVLVMSSAFVRYMPERRHGAIGISKFLPFAELQLGVEPKLTQVYARIEVRQLSGGAYADTPKIAYFKRTSEHYAIRGTDAAAGDKEHGFTEWGNPPVVEIVPRQLDATTTDPHLIQAYERQLMDIGQSIGTLLLRYPEIMRDESVKTYRQANPDTFLLPAAPESPENPS